MTNIVYLLHFERKLKRTQHYIGTTRAGRLSTRIREHQQGYASRTTARFIKAHIGFVVAKTWMDSSFGVERALKARGHYASWCPICRQVDHTQDLGACLPWFAAEPLQLVCIDISSERHGS